MNKYERDQIERKVPKRKVMYSAVERDGMNDYVWRILECGHQFQDSNGWISIGQIKPRSFVRCEPCYRNRLKGIWQAAKSRAEDAS